MMQTANVTSSHLLSRPVPVHRLQSVHSKIRMWMMTLSTSRCTSIRYEIHSPIVASFLTCSVLISFVYRRPWQFRLTHRWNLCSSSLRNWVRNMWLLRTPADIVSRSSSCVSSLSQLIRSVPLVDEGVIEKNAWIAFLNNLENDEWCFTNSHSNGSRLYYASQVYSPSYTFTSHPLKQFYRKDFHIASSYYHVRINDGLTIVPWFPSFE